MWKAKRVGAIGQQDKVEIECRSKKVKNDLTALDLKQVFLGSFLK